MGFPLFRVTLDNDIEGPLVISEPGGWDEAKLKLERNEEFHSLVEYYDQPLTFYGEDTVEDGGIQYIRNIEQTQGPDAQITITIEVSHDEGETYEELVENTVEIESIKEMDFYKLESGVIRNGFWQYFMNRRDTPINLASLRDLENQARTLINPVTIQMPSQYVRLFYAGNSGEPGVSTIPQGTAANIVTGQYWQVDFMNETVSEIEEKFTLPIETNTSEPVSLFTVKYAGDYQFNIRIHGWLNTASIPDPLKQLIGPPTYDYADFILNIDGTEYTFNHAEAFYNGVDGIDGTVSRFTYAATHTLNEKSEIKIYARLNDTVSSGGFNFEWLRPTLTENSILEIIADTSYQDTDCEGFFIHEAGNSITDRIIGRNGTFYSEYLGNTLTQIQSYAEDGCGSKYAVTRGLNVRGYSLTDKPFFMSFNTWWDGINPLLNLGLGYEKIGSPELEVLRVEPKEYFYNETPSVYLDFVNNIERGYDSAYIWKVIEIGFEKWSAESASGVDDPQSQRIYNTRFKTIGRDIKIMSKFIGASLAIEQTRRNRVEQGKDWRLDDDVIIIAMRLDESPEFQPELDENFADVDNLLNSDTRYNIRLSVARNFERWKSFFNGCLQWYVAGGAEFKFASGQGNFDMTSTLDGSDCEGSSPEVAVDEKGNIDTTNDHLFMPITYSFEHPLTWDQYKTIRDNRHNAIGVSRTDENYKICFIKSLEYEITHGKGTFVVWVKGSSSGYDPEDVYFD